MARGGNRRMSCRSPSKGSDQARQIRGRSGVMNDENVERVAIFRSGRGDEAPIVGIGQPSKQRLRERERTERYQGPGLPAAR
jgi:hypothetical protein